MLKLHKRIVSILLTITMILSIIVVAPFTVSAATYNYLFPVNNGGAIAYAYGYSAAYGGNHTGIDIHSNGDDTIYAATDGTVVATANSCGHVSCGYACEHYSTYGNYIKIRNSDGTYAYYGHLKKDGIKVSTGMSVSKGQAIAIMGSSGYSTGKHLHFELRLSDGKTTVNVNPASSGGSVNYSYSGYGIANNVDLGTDFYALILNTYHWKPIENVNGELVLGTENKSKTQLWKFERQEDMSYKIISMYDQSVMDLWNFGNTDGTDIGLGGNNNTDAQRWYIRNNGSGYSLIPKCSQNGAMDLTGNNGADGTNIQFWTINGGSAQTFSIYKIENVIQYLSCYMGENFYAKIVNTHYNMPIENRDGNVVLGIDTKSKTQLWKFENQKDGTYIIESLYDQNVIDLCNFGDTDGTNIGVWRKNNLDGQKWYIIKNKSGYSLIPKCSQNGSMDLTNNDGSDGTNIQFWTINESDAQTFTINKINSVVKYFSADMGDSFYAKIVNTYHDMPIENRDGNVVLGIDEKSKTQIWKFERQDDMSYKIISMYDQNLIDLCNFGNTDGTNIGVWGNNNMDGQKWYILPSELGYSLIPKCSQNGAMDLTNNDGSDGANIQFWTINESDAQIFSICKIDSVDEYLKVDVFGDANDDGDVNIQDATIVQMVVAKFPVENFNEKLADYDQNGEVNIRDATSIQMIVAKLV